MASTIVELSSGEMEIAAGGMRLDPYDPDINVSDATVYGPGPYRSGYITQAQWNRDWGGARFNWPR
ncbi:MAG: hypothetical protein EOP66_12255 [Sphingomonas sp.]|nr:MAG: hypothetical protein EOP66_12255 [Sphingomonas sp.]